MRGADLEIRRSLKNWVARYPTPTVVRAKLLNSAASQFFPKSRLHSSQGYPGQNHDLLSWALVYTLGRGLAPMRVLS